MMTRRLLGRTGLLVSPVGFGSFKIGRNEQIKYPAAYPLPTDAEAAALLNAVLEAGVNYIDTAPAYGVAEERIGRALGDRLCECVVSTKAGEVFTGGRSLYDFSRPAVLRSIEESSRRLRREPLDLVFMHGHADDLDILNDTPIVETMLDLKAQGRIRAIGFSGKTVAAARQALSWADALMVEYHLHDRSHEAVISEAALRGVGIVVKKGLASGQLPAAESIRFVLGNPHVTSLVIGGLDLAHLQANLAEARQIRAA